MSDMEEFMRDKIARLRSEADALEKVLKEFTGAKGRSTRQAGAPTGGFGAVMDALEEAGPAGMSLDEMIQAASDRGYDVNRATLRSQLWTAKNNDKVEALEPGRYRSLTAVEAPKIVDQDDYSSGFRTGPLKPEPAPTPQVNYDLNDEIPF
ncbi:MAG: hypothetical protein ACSLE1_18040 [Sphingobium sp.]